ncbi:MAG: hypothetical protein LQ339_008912 [Xanthoria mediterranea]|nr:MAG: hypothetical protein LQ339_008912 [Xanthoria mediterranea]
MYAQSQGGQSDSDKSHSHFLGILEYTLEILKPHAPTADDQPGVDRETNPGNDQSEEFENKFSKLELQEPSNKFQQFLDAPDIDRAIRTEVKLGPRYEADLAKDQKEEYAAAHFNTTITFVRDLEEQLQAQFPTKVDYPDKVGLFYLSQCSAQNVSHEFREDVKAYKLADNVMLTTYVLIVDLQREGHLRCLQNPESRDESVPWLQKSPDEKYLDNRSRLREVYPLLDFISRRTEVRRMPEDELIRGVREMGPGNPIPVWLVFAFHCFLNAQHTLGVAGSQLQKLLNIIDTLVARGRIEEEIRKILHDCNLPPLKPFALHKQHPLLCGLWAFALRLHAQNVGIEFVNTTGSVIATTHLYNAVLQHPGVPRGWRDMEWIQPSASICLTVLSWGSMATSWCQSTRETWSNPKPGDRLYKPRSPKHDEGMIPIIEFFDDLRDILELETKETSFDYFLMHRICWKLLRRINELCRPQITQLYGAGYLP